MSGFDEKALEWDKNKMNSERTIAVADRLKEFIPKRPGIHALEFGAGTGLLSFYLKDRFSEITLMDNSKEMLRMAEAKMDDMDRKKFKTFFFNLEEETYTGKKFDIIYSQMVLHHIKDTTDIFYKFSKLLNPGGMLSIADLYQEDGSFHDGALNIHHGFDPEKLKNMLIKLDFRDILIEPCFVIRRENSMKNISEYPVFLMTAVKQGSR